MVNIAKALNVPGLPEHPDYIFTISYSFYEGVDIEAVAENLAILIQLLSDISKLLQSRERLLRRG